MFGYCVPSREEEAHFAGCGADAIVNAGAEAERFGFSAPRISIAWNSFFAKSAGPSARIARRWSPWA